MSINIKTDKGLVKIAPTSYNELTDLPNIKSNGNTTYITDKSGNNVATIDSGGISTTGIVVDNITLGGKDISQTIAEGSFSGDFKDLTNNPIADNSDGSVSFADASGNKIAAINAKGVESVEFKAGNHKLTEKADQAYVLYAITELENAAFSGDYNDLENAPIDNVNDGTLIFTDESGNKIGQVDRDGFTSTEFAVGPHRLTNKAERNAPLSNFTEDDEHQLVSSAEKVYWSNKSEFSGKFGDLTENPIIDNKSGNLEYQDVNGNTIVRIDATGLSTTAVSISEGDVATLIAEKADRASLNASNNRISTLESTVSTQGSDINKLRLDINEIDGELSTYKTEVASTYAKQADLLGVTNRVSTAEEEIDTLQSTVAVHASKVDNIEASDWEFIIVDENSNKGLTLASDGVLYVKEVGVLGGLVDERLAHLENYFSTGEDADNNLNKWHEIVDFLNGFEETDQALESIIATKADKSTVTALETAYKTADINLGTRIDGVIANYKKADLDITTAYKDADKAITTAYTDADATTLISAKNHTDDEINNVKDEYKKADDELQIQINARAFQTDLDNTNELVAYVTDNYVAKSDLANEVVTESLVTDAITLNESEFIFADSSGNKIAEINDGGIESTLFIAGVHKLTEKADITYVTYADDATLNSAKAYTDSKFSSAVTGVKMNGSTNKPSNGIVDLGTVITDVSGKQDKLVSGTSIKTINGVSILGLGNIEIKTETGGITLETDPIFTASAAYGIQLSDINNWNNKTSNVGTVTKVSTGKGLTGGDITTEGVIKCNLNSDDPLGTINTSDKLYAVGVDANNKLCVKVPWANDNTTYTFANGTNGFTVIPKGGLAQTVTVTPSITNNVTYSNTLTNGRIAVFDGTFGKIKDSGFTIETSVPSGAKFTDTIYTLPEAGTDLGGVKSGGDVTISEGVISVNDDSHNHIISNVDGLLDALNGKAPISHASSNTTYGVGTETNYGHVKISNADVDSISGADGLVAGMDHYHSSLAPKASPAFTGTPKAPTAAKGTNTTQVATTAFVQEALPTALPNPKTLTIQKNGTNIATYNGSSDVTANITVPTNLASLTNDLKSLKVGNKSYNGSTEITITAADLGLSSALKYHGTTTTALTDGATTKPIVIGGSNHNQEQGCVVAYNNSSFVWTGSAWEELGNPGNYKVVQSAVSSPSASGNATAFIDTISLDANGKITVTKKNVQTASTSVYGITKLSSATDSTSEALAATPKAVKSAYDLANSKWTYNANTIKAIKVNAAGTADIANSVNWTNVNNKPTNLSQFTDDVVAGKYLPLSGGTISGFFAINGSDASYTQYKVNNAVKGEVGWHSSYGIFIKNETSEKFLNITDEGLAQFDGNTLIHSGNIGSYALPLSGGSIKSSSFSPFAVDRDSDVGAAAIGFTRKNVVLGFLGFNDAICPKWYDSAHNEYSLIHSGNIGSYALPLTGGTISGDVVWEAGTGNKTMLPGHIYRQLFDDNGNVYDHYCTGNGIINTFANLRVGSNDNGGSYKTLRFGGDGTFTWDDKTVIHSGNISDLLDSRYFKAENGGAISSDVNLATLKAGSYWVYDDMGTTHPVPITYSSLVVLGQSYYSPQLCVEHNASRAWLRGIYNTGTPSASSWHEIAFTDSNVASATNAAAVNGIKIAIVTGNLPSSPDSSTLYFVK